MRSAFYIPVLLAYLARVKVESTCDSAEGQCINIYECEPFLTLLKKSERTSEDIALLRKAKCGIESNSTQVCCPNQCLTLEGNPGYCMNLYHCPNLSNLLTPPIDSKQTAILQSYRCESASDPLSVCCSAYGNPNAVKPAQQCVLTAMPPDARTGCCGTEAKSDIRIYEGSKTGINMYPWLVLIEYEKGNYTKLFCGGALISAKYVLTTAACVIGPVLKYGTPTNVRLGEYDSANDGPDCILTESGELECTDGMITIPIERTIPHPDYNTNSNSRRNDIALVRLSQSASYTDFIRPICLPTSDRTIIPPNEFYMFAAGWGAVNSTARRSNNKRHVRLPFKTLESCQAGYKGTSRNITLWRGQLCAGGVEGQDTCTGDSGVPLVYQALETWEVTGMTSFGAVPCGSKDIAGVYTNVFQYMHWLRKEIKP